jgi:hypothetical protein
MRVSKSIILYVPELFVGELDKYLRANPTKINFQRVYFFYIIHHLTIMKIRYKKEDFVNLNRKYLRDITVSNIDSYIKILVKGEFIISNESYQNGFKSLRYKLNPKYVDSIVEVEVSPNSRLGRRIIKNLRKGKAH